jgi:hypothetical protein
MFDKEKSLIKTTLLWITNQTLASFCGIAKKEEMSFDLYRTLVSTKYHQEGLFSGISLVNLTRSTIIQSRYGY